MSEFSDIPLKRVSLQELIDIVKTDLAGWNKARTLALYNLTDRFIDQNPDWPFRDEFEKLRDLEDKRTEEQDRRLMSLITEEMGFGRELLETEILRTYANQNGYEITEQ